MLSASTVNIKNRVHVIVGEPPNVYFLMFVGRTNVENLQSYVKAPYIRWERKSLVREKKYRK